MQAVFTNTYLIFRGRHSRPWLTSRQTYNEEKGFVFIARCFDATEVFGHKREFLHDTEPYVGQPVSFYEVTEKGGEAKKVLVHMRRA